MGPLAAVSIDTISVTGANDAAFLVAVERFKSLRLLSLLNDPNCFGSTYSKEVDYTDLRWQEKLKSPDVFHIIATRAGRGQGAPGQPSFPDGDWIGMIVPRRLKSDSCIRVQDELYVITGMFVHPDARGIGVGSQLVKHALEVIRADRTRRHEAPARVELTVDTDNAAAIALYKSCGFCVYQETSMENSTSGRPELGMYIRLED